MQATYRHCEIRLSGSLPKGTELVVRKGLSAGMTTLAALDGGYNVTGCFKYLLT